MTAEDTSLPADSLRIAVAQLDSELGNVAANLAAVRAARDEAGRQEADLIVFPELFLSGAPFIGPARSPDMIAACAEAVDRLAHESEGQPAVLVGTPWREGDRLFNVMLLIADGKVAASRAKVDTGARGGVREADMVSPGPLPGPLAVKGVRIGVAIGSDMDTPDVPECLAETGAEILIVPDAAPYCREGADGRLSRIVARVVECDLPLLHVNAVGGTGEWVFDGASLALNADRSLPMQFPSFQPRVRMTTWQRFENGWRCLEAPFAQRTEGDAADYEASLLALRDLVRKSGRDGLILDFSTVADGGLSAVLALDAIGADKVKAVVLGSLEDAPPAGLRLAGALGLTLAPLPVVPMADAMAEMLAPLGASSPPAGPLRVPALALAAEALGLVPLLPAPRADDPDAEPSPPALFPLRAFNPVKDLAPAEIERLLTWRSTTRPVGAKGPERLTLDGWPAPAHAGGPAGIPGPRLRTASFVDGPSLFSTSLSLRLTGPG
ncbi:nitrilase-related carbon-nitrogen hydrolase [Aquabacter sp. P-9]|uniref:nitrilase-related carbon-nitrogen hydrolase n=1 Tax=Aquabacter sediminis TaxID=3029197 RepID=UPI00237D3E92|nr:nitrilase-related carbon-nitrogen hydrolase [Aquabacter sp. P-9]MDE1568391.1 NAD+ synthase [Aquabacter sp. P-9]